MVPGARADRRFWPRDTRGLLEICEQGFALQQGMKTHCQETADVLESLQDTCETTMGTFLEQMQTTLGAMQEQSERPVQIDWAPMFDHLQRIHPEVVESVVSRQEEITQRLESQMDLRITQAVEQMQVSRRQEEGHEFQELRREIREYQMGTMASLEESVNKSHMRFEQVLLEQSQTQTTEWKTLQDVQAAQAKIVHQLSIIEPILKVQMTKQLEDSRVALFKNSTLIDEIHATVHEDVLGLYHEIGKMQREMNIHFVVPAKVRAKKSEGKDNVTFRDMWAQTATAKADMDTQTDDNLLQMTRSGKKAKGKQRAEATAVAPRSLRKAPQAPKRKVFADEEAMRTKMRQALIRPEYNVANQYFERGCAQSIARSQTFENMTFTVILMNALWIAVDTDYNDAQLLINADTIFLVVENFFCTYFTVELLIRFMAFRRLRYCFRDFWFVFDSILVLTMVFETWIITVAAVFDSELSSSVGSFSVLRLARLVKMFRMARMARLLRMVPELVVILKGISAAFRSVGFLHVVDRHCYLHLCNILY